MRIRYGELPKDRDIWICCGVGQRAYYANAVSVTIRIPSLHAAGGYTTYKAFVSAGLVP